MYVTPNMHEEDEIWGMFIAFSACVVDDLVKCADFRQLVEEAPGFVHCPHSPCIEALRWPWIPDQTDGRHYMVGISHYLVRDKRGTTRLGPGLYVADFMPFVYPHSSLLGAKSSSMPCHLSIRTSSRSSTLSRCQLPHRQDPCRS